MGREKREKLVALGDLDSRTSHPIPGAKREIWYRAISTVSVTGKTELC